MYYTYVVRPGDAPHGRAPQFFPFWKGCVDKALRIGLLCELLAFLSLTVLSLLNLQIRSFGFVHLTSRLDHFSSSLVAIGAVAASLLWVIGSCFIGTFRSIADDESGIKHPRGYRAGFKAVWTGTLLDSLSAVMMTIYFFASYTFFEDQWTVNTVGIQAMCVFGLVSRLIHCAALASYAAGFFCIETYHSEGTAECWGWSVALLFKMAALFEFLAAITACHIFDFIATPLLGLALMTATLWALTFEDTMNARHVDLSQSALRNEYYKSKNAMAYYGPPIEQGMELIAQRA